MTTSSAQWMDSASIGPSSLELISSRSSRLKIRGPAAFGTPTTFSSAAWSPDSLKCKSNLKSPVMRASWTSPRSSRWSIRSSSYHLSQCTSCRQASSNSHLLTLTTTATASMNLSRSLTRSSGGQRLTSTSVKFGMMESLPAIFSRVKLRYMWSTIRWWTTRQRLAST